MNRSAPLSQESRRLAALASYDVLDTPAESDFDEVAQLAAQICETPIAVVNLIGEGRQFFKAEVGLGVRETPLETSFCARAILEDDFLIIPDATRDTRFDRNPLVTGEGGLRFYAGALLKTDEGLPIGTLCVLDTRPRDLTPLQQRALRVLARQVMALLDVRLLLRTRLESETRHSAIVASAIDYAIIATDLDGRITEWNSGAQRILGWSEAEMLGQSAELFFTPEDRIAGVVEREMRDATTQGRGADERWHMRKSGERFWASGEMMALRGSTGQLVGYTKILRDRTAQKESADQLRASEARLRASQKAGNIGTFEVELSSGIITVTPEFCAIFGLEQAEHQTPDAIEALILPEDRHLASNARTRKGGDAMTDVEYRIRRRSDGALRWIERRARFSHTPSGLPTRMFGTVQDITPRKLAERRINALLELGDRLREASDIAEVIAIASSILGRTLDGCRAGYVGIDWYGRTFTLQHGWAAEGVDPLTGVHDLARFTATMRSLSAGTALVVEDIESLADLAEDRPVYAAMGTRAQIMVPLIRRGDLTHVLFIHARDPRVWSKPEANFVRNVADRTEAVVAKLQAEKEQAILNQELNHRLKNTLAMVHAIASQTLKDVTEQDAVQALSSRLQALSTAHDILLQNNWRAAQLDSVARGVLALHAQDWQLHLGGPAVELAPRAGLSVSLLLHELATNAVKYGALSQEGGQISILWRIEQTEGGPVLHLEWIETGGPPVTPPSRRGFGSRLIRMGLVGTGHNALDYRPTGLVASFTAPVALLLQD